VRQRIIFNGIEYSTPEEMPADIRAEYDRVMRLLEDRNGNGTPDVLENGERTTRVDTRIYTDASRLTPADRQLFDRLRSGAGTGEHGTMESTFNVTFIGKTEKGWRIQLPPETRQLVNRLLYAGALLLLALLVFFAWPR
jgi:hypothetical protein